MNSKDAISVIDLGQAVKACPAIANHFRITRPRSHRCSSIDDVCKRRMYYRIAEWDKAAPIDAYTAGIFQTGNDLEDIVRRNIVDIGLSSNPQWRIVGGQTPAKDNIFEQYNISGTCDGFLQIKDGGEWNTCAVVDIKTMSPNVYPRINTKDDLNKFAWTKKYIGQLMLYALAHNIDTCAILAVNKTNIYDIKFIVFELDMAHCDSILQRVAEVNTALAAHVPPEGVNDIQECSKCTFRHICLPECSTSGGKHLDVMDNVELQAVLDRLEELSPAVEEYAELEAARDAMLEKGKDVICGNWLVQWKEIEISYKPKDAYTIKQWRKKICKLQ